MRVVHWPRNSAIYVFDNVVPFVVNKTKDGGVYLISDTKTGTETTTSKESLAQHGGRKEAYKFIQILLAHLCHGS